MAVVPCTVVSQLINLVSVVHLSVYMAWCDTSGVTEILLMSQR